MSLKTVLPAALFVLGLALSACGAFEVGMDTPSGIVPAATTPPAATSGAATATTRPAATEAPATVPVLPSATTAASATNAPATATPLPPSSTTAVVSDATVTAPSPATATPLATAAILILNPGSTSSVSSPVRVAGQAEATFEQNLVVQITDANGAVIATTPTTIKSSFPQSGPFDTLVPFSVSGKQPGRVSVFSTSARDGGMLYLASVEVTLLAAGSAALAAGPTNHEVHAILAPAPQAEISGGRLPVTGYSDYVFEGQLALALCGEGGAGAPDPVCGTVDNVLATGTAKINSTDVGQPGLFAGALNYKVTGPVQARLAVYSRAPRDGGIVHLNTVNVKLMP